MKHVKRKLTNGEIVCFSKNGAHSYCGDHLPRETCVETEVKVTCGHCIAKIELALSVKRNEYV